MNANSGTYYYTVVALVLKNTADEDKILDLIQKEASLLKQPVGLEGFLDLGAKADEREKEARAEKWKGIKESFLSNFKSGAKSFGYMSLDSIAAASCGFIDGFTLNVGGSMLCGVYENLTANR